MSILEQAQRKRGLGNAVRSLALAAVAATALAGVSSLPAQAQEHWRWEGDIHHFHERDLARWRGGHWFHGPHGGRPGWWWVVGDFWYFYPAPIYPYPDPFLPPGVVAGPPVAPQPVAPPAPAQYYYCDNPPGYYPYVSTCPTPWRAVPAQ